MTAIGIGIGIPFAARGLPGLAGESFPLAVSGQTAVLDIDPINNRAYSGGATTTPAAVLTVTRAAPATTYYEQADGSLISFAANTLRLGDRGILAEESRTNVVLHCRDLTNAAWTKTNMTAAKDQTGPDGVANGASSITATASNATILQAITLASSARWQSARVKRLVGTGTIEMTMDNGTTWVDITDQVAASWGCAEIPTQTISNPTVGFRIGTSGDSIAVDFVQNENTNFARSSPIPTTTAAVTRSVDVITVTSPPTLTSGLTYVVATNGHGGGSSPIPTPVLFDISATLVLIFNRYTATHNVFFARNAANAIYLSANLSSYLPGKWPQCAVGAYADNDMAVCLQDGILTLDTSGDYDAPDRIHLGSGTAGSQSLCGYIDRFVLFNTRLPDAAVRAVSTVNRQIYVMAEGDSMTAGTSAWPVQARTYNMPARGVVQTFGVSGSSMGNATGSLDIAGTTRTTKVDQRLDDILALNPAAKHLLVLRSGYNDYAADSDSTATYISELQAYCTARKAAGHKVVVVTTTPSTTAGFNTWRATVDTAILDFVTGGYADYVVDLTGVSGCDDADASNTALYPDGIHPSEAQDIVIAEAIYDQAISLELAA